MFGKHLLQVKHKNMGHKDWEQEGIIKNVSKIYSCIEELDQTKAFA